MIVTCESCKSKYKLDDAKITGRGAKITCPRCKNVFVVYARPGDAPAAATPPTTPAWETPKPGGLADVVRAQDARRAEVSSPSAGAVGSNSPATKAATPKPAPAPAVGRAPEPPSRPEWDDDEPTRIGQSTREDAPGGHEVVRPPEGKPTAPAAKADPAEIAARAASLDFRKVGVTTWKVKVRIGLVYDFSDIRTLRKYIQDGRVTPADVVSWDGKSWKPIGEIPDLDLFFVETWEALAARRETTPERAPASPTIAIPAPDEPTAQLKNGGEPDRFQDPFEDLKRKQRDRVEQRRANATTQPKAPPPPEPASRLPLLVGVLLLLVLAGAGYAWWSGMLARPVASTPVPATAGAAKPGTPAPDPTEAIRQGIETAMTGNHDPDTPPTPTDTHPGKVPVLPADDPAPTTVGMTPVRPGPDATPRTPHLPPAAANQAHDTTAAEHEAIGDDAARGGDWATAAQAYQKALALDPRSWKLTEKLGEAQYQANDYGAAQPTLQKAASMGAKDAPKYLGHILASQGDKAGAIGQYQQYLKGSPHDAADIQKLISQLSGG